VKQPYWPIQEAKDLAARGQIWVQVTRASAFFSSTGEAVKVAKDAVLNLDIGSFSETVQLTQDIADVYGITLESRGWYLKLCIDRATPEVCVISLHPLERPLVTNGGSINP
jgi:hypothetical protein